MASVVFNAISCLVVLFVAYLMGFRPEAGALEWGMIVFILLLFTLALSWISVMFGLLAKTAEGPSAFSYLLLFMLFISSAFAPTESMPRFIRVFPKTNR
jgi:ABC-2 type transport system permease protein